MFMIKNIANLLRVKDWLKNIIIFFPLIFSGSLFKYDNYTILFLGFITFCIISSFIYVINDILDVKKDRLHPQKKFLKPIAAGVISLKTSYYILILIFLVSSFLVYFQKSLHTSIFVYLVLAISYNLFFKKIPFFELIILSAGYVVRVDSGSKIIGVDSSVYMLISIFFLGNFFILIKRLCELNQFELKEKNLQGKF